MKYSIDSWRENQTLGYVLTLILLTLTLFVILVLGVGIAAAIIWAARMCLGDSWAVVTGLALFACGLAAWVIMELEGA